MGIYRNLVKFERNFKKSIQDNSETIQRQPTNTFKTSEWGSAMPGREGRWSDDRSEHISGWTSTFLYCKHWPTSGISEASSTRRFSVSTSNPTSELDTEFGGNKRQPTNDDKRILEVRTTKNCKNLVWSDTSRVQASQEKINTDTSGDRLGTQSYLPTRQGYEVGSKTETLAIWKLCRDKCMVPSNVLETRSTNQYPFDQYSNTSSSANLRELPPDYRTQYSQDELLEMIKRDQSFHETNTNVLHDFEIDKFSKVYGISGVIALLSYDDLEFWIKDHKDFIYIWSRMENSVIFGGHDMKEAMINFLFHQENLRYVNEYTHDLVPLDADDLEVKEWVESCEHIRMEITEESLKPLKEKPKSSGKKKKQKKKKNKNKQRK